MIKNRKLVPTINFTTPNPKLKLEQSPFKISLDYQNWEPSESLAETRYAGLNCLGVGGTNVFAVLCEAPETGQTHNSSTAAVKPNENEQHRQDVICISAKTQSQLVDCIKRISATDQKFPLSSIAYNVNISRSHLPVRYVSLVSDDTDASKWFEHAVNAVEAQKVDDRISFARQSLSYVCNPVDSVSDDQITKLMMDYRCKKFAKEYTHLMASNEISSLASSEFPSASELAKTLAFEGALYSQFKSWGLKIDSFVGTGFGKYVELMLAGTPIENWIDYLRKEAEYFESDLAKGRFSCFEKMGQVGIAVSETSRKCENTIYRCKPNPINTEEGSHIYLSHHASFDANDIWSFLVEALSKGININWDEYYPRGANKKISLPGYPFEKKRYWVGDDEVVS